MSRVPRSLHRELPPADLLHTEFECRIDPLAAARTTITAIETKTARPCNLKVEGKYAAGKPHAVTPWMLKHANMKLLLLGSPYRP